jgi:hypothetical protein
MFCVASTGIKLRVFTYRQNIRPFESSMIIVTFCTFICIVIIVDEFFCTIISWTRLWKKTKFE